MTNLIATVIISVTTNIFCPDTDTYCQDVGGIMKRMKDNDVRVTEVRQTTSLSFNYAKSNHVIIVEDKLISQTKETKVIEKIEKWVPKIADIKQPTEEPIEEIKK